MYDESSGHYTADDGIFTSPLDGFYQFELNLVSLSEIYTIEIYLNDVIVYQIYGNGQFSGTNSQRSTSYLFELKMNRLDKMQLKSIGFKNDPAPCFENQMTCSSFSGKLRKSS